jgi:hypothetical protein
VGALGGYSSSAGVTSKAKDSGCHNSTFFLFGTSIFHQVFSPLRQVAKTRLRMPFCEIYLLWQPECILSLE